jgi:hypothetical protein
VLGHLIYLEKMEGLPKIRFTSWREIKHKLKGDYGL